MNEEVLDLVLKYPDLLDKFAERYRRELFILYFQKNPINTKMPKYVKVAMIYNEATRFKVTSVGKAVSAILGTNAANTHMLIGYAKGKDLITESVKTTNGKGYGQKNYVPKKS